MSKAYGFDEEFQEIIFYAAQLHDIGKIGIPDEILLKPGKLTKDEYEIIKKHSKQGYDILVDSRSKYLRMGAQISLTHHERYDGRGYPNHLSEDLIPMEGRIVSIADCFDALATKRPYKEAWTFDDAFSYIIEGRGEQFDPELVDIFAEKKSEIKEIHEKFNDNLLL